MIDPKLLNKSSVKELTNSHDLVLSRFRKIFRNLEKCSSEKDRFWRAAFELTDFSEFRGVSLGYSVASQDGKGWASTLRLRVLRSAREVVSAGLQDPEFFELLAIFEPGIGADRVSDMIGTILIGPLCAFTKRVCKTLSIKTKAFTIKGFTYQLPWIKGLAGGDRYIILVPNDILTDISIGLNRDTIAEMIAHNTALRQHLNTTIGRHWRSLVESSSGKKTTRSALFGNIGAFKDMIARYRETAAKPYNFEEDPKNVVFWYGCVRSALEAEELKITIPAKPTLKALRTAAISMALYFQRSVEENGLRDVLFPGGMYRDEKVVQAVFFAMVKTHSEQNGLAISLGFNKSLGTIELSAERSNYRVLVKLKASTSMKLVEYFDELLEANRRSRGCGQSLFVVFQIRKTFGNVGRLKERYDATPSSGFKPELIIINAYGG